MTPSNAGSGAGFSRSAGASGSEVRHRQPAGTAGTNRSGLLLDSGSSADNHLLVTSPVTLPPIAVVVADLTFGGASPCRWSNDCPPQNNRRRLRVRPFEDRLTSTPFTVNTLADTSNVAGQFSL